VNLTDVVREYTFVGIDGSVPEPGGNALGVSQVCGIEGEEANVAVVGTSILVAGGAIAVGQAVEVGPNGFGVAKTTGVMVARALEAAKAAGDFIEVLLVQN
jgi:hypothetical protein